MKRFFSLKHAKETKEKLAKCIDHENGKIIRSTGWSKFPLLLKENNKSILNTHMSYPESPVLIQPQNHFCDTYEELPPGTTVVFTQDSIGEVSNQFPF